MEQHCLTFNPGMECALKFRRYFKFFESEYQELYKQLEILRKQLLITDYLITKVINN